MAMVPVTSVGKDKGSSNSLMGGLDAGGKYVRYTPEQVEALERVYNECPKPSSLRRQQLIRECPILCNIEPKQIKVWFQNRRFVFSFITLAGAEGFLSDESPTIVSLHVMESYWQFGRRKKWTTTH